MTTEDRQGNSHGEDGRFVSVREHLERAAEESWRAHEQRHADNEKALVEAARLAERITSNQWAAHQDAHNNASRELVEQRMAVQEKLNELNNLRRDYVADRAQYVLRDVFESRLDPLEAFRSKALGFGALFALLSGAVGAAIAKAIG